MSRINADAPDRIVFPMLEAYGDGGFRIGGARHEGSVVIINGAVSPWDVAGVGALEPGSFQGILDAAPRPDFILFGSGPKLTRPPAPVSDALRAAGMGLELMDTPAACRVYATLVGQGRHIAAALIAVD